MSIASEILNYANGLGDAYDAVNDMGGIIPQDRNMNNLDTSIRTIPQNLGPTYTAGNGIVIDANDEISIDDTVVAELSDLPSDFTGATSLTDGTAGLVPKPLAGDETKFLSGNGQWTTVSQYNLPIASANDLGGIKVGSNLSIDAGTGVLSATVPTVNDATLTIQKNGTDVATFTANASSNATANISVPTKTSDITNNGSDNTSTYVEADELAAVATSGDYGDLLNKPTIPAAQVNSDWDAASGVAQILNKPSLATVATSGDYGDLLNKPTIPTVNDATLTITQNGTTAGTFTANSNTSTTVALTDTTYSDFTGATSLQAGTAGLVPAPTTADPDKFLKGDGTWGTPTDTTYSAGTNVQISAGNVISATDTTYSAFTGATSGAAGTAGLVPAPAAGDQNKVLKGDGTWADDSTELVEMVYGESSAWAKFIAAYNAKKIVYCRASSNANPGSGAKTRKAFMAYVNNETTPTSVEFQYVRSVSSKSSSQPVDQVFVYTLTNANGGTWSVVTRDMAPKLAAGTNTSVSYSSGTYTVSATDTTYSDMTGATSGTAGTAGLVPAPAAGDQNKVLTGAGTWDTRAKITMTSTDPGSGSALAADNYVAVYGNSDGQITSTDLANNAVATANLQDYSVTRVKLNHLDLVNNGEWVCIAYAYLGTTTDTTTPITITIPADYQGLTMQYKIVGAYELPAVNGGANPYLQVKTGGTWRTNCFYSYQAVWNANWAWYGASGSGGYSGTSAVFGHQWNCASDWDSCTFECTVSNGYAGSHWTWTGTAGGVSGGHGGTWNGGGRVQDGAIIEAFRLNCGSTVRWGAGSGFAVYVRKRNY